MQQPFGSTRRLKSVFKLEQFIFTSYFSLNDANFPSIQILDSKDNLSFSDDSADVYLLIQLPETKAVERLFCPPDNANAQQPHRTETGDRLKRLRAEMRKPTAAEGSALDAYIITNYDAHQSQQLASRDKRLEYISGFVGNKGMAIVSKDKAVIWVDDSEIIQANEMLSCEWMLESINNPQVSMFRWIQKNLRSYARVGADPTLVPYHIWDSLSPTKIVQVRHNLIDAIWTGRPEYINFEAQIIEVKYAGKSWEEKVAKIREEIKKKNCDAIIITALDEIAWLLNVRGEHISHLPVIRAYIIMSDNQLHLYTDTRKLHLAVNSTLKTDNCFTSSQCVRLHDYNNVWGDMKTFSQIYRKFCIPMNTSFAPSASKAVFETIPPDNRILTVSPIIEHKSVKNEVERQGMRNAHIRDAAAFCDAMAYIDSKIKMGETWDELKIADHIDQLRRQQKLSTGISYDTVVAFGAHSSYNYHLNNLTSLKVDKSSLVLIDSGGQYQDGTTAVTRTFTFGTATEKQKDIYTRVLKGLIDFSLLSFPSTLTYHEADLLARVPLWNAKLDYKHYTGHGIGSQLSYEEGPILIDRHHSTETFKEGNFIFVGPGYAKKMKYGVRLRNVLEVISDGNGTMNEHLAFETATLIPFEPKLIHLKLLSPEQIMWLNKYNARIREVVGAELKSQRRMGGFHWMMEKVENIPDKFLDHTSTSSHLSYQNNVLYLTIFVSITIFLISK